VSYLRTQEILESQMEMLFGRLRKTEENPLLGGDMTTYVKAIRETAKTLLGYYALEVESMPARIAEGVRQLDAEDAAMMENQKVDRLHDDLVKLGEQLSAIANNMKCAWEVRTVPSLGGQILR
jgi:hypothetical protein